MTNSKAKARLDKYYNLAKEKGYRARSAFKLIQMNNKYKFLNGAHILIDLCAAPGSWLQVAAQEMPPRRRIIGVDLDPIKFIGEVDTIVSDITSDDCRYQLRGILGTHKADVVLHDGAPNVGMTWDNDAFNQNLLVLHSLKLAVEFLAGGGVFVTKIFRSQDYFSLFNVLSKLFRTVETSKPLSSRSQSAEIFLVCLDFIGEEYVDQSLLEVSVVFKEAKNAGGYEDFNFYKKLRLTEFLKENDPGTLSLMLSEYSEIIIDVNNDVKKVLSDECIELFKDLKILGRGDINKILKMRSKVIRMVRGGEITIPDLEFMRENEESSDEEEMKEKSAEEKIEEIKRLLEKKEKRSEMKNDGDQDCFFDDNVFDRLRMLNEEMNDGIKDEMDMNDEEVEYIDVSSCSDSLDLDVEEMMCVARLKDNPERFIEDSIDRYVCDPDEDLPNYLRDDQEEYYSRPAKNEERRLNKKEKEALARRKTRAERRAEIYMKDLIVDDSEEEGEIAKKVYKSSFKKTKNKSRVVFPKNGRFGIPKGKGRLVTLDRRMKADKRNKRE